MYIIMSCAFAVYRLCLNQQTDTELKCKLRHDKEQLDVPNGFLYQLTNEEVFGQ